MNSYDKVMSKIFIGKITDILNANIRDDISDDEFKSQFKDAAYIGQLGVKDDIKYLIELPAIYFDYKIQLVMEHIDMTDKEYYSLRNFYYYKKRYSMLLRYIFNIKRDFKDEYKKYFELEANL